MLGGDALQHTQFNSGIYEGTVRHRRLQPVGHALNYRVVMAYLDLDEVDEVMEQHPLWSSVSKWALVRFSRKDYFNAESAKASTPEDLKEQVILAFEHELGVVPARVGVLTNLRFWGYIINPVSFYYGFDGKGNLLGILAEITNTPWGERFHYSLSCQPVDGLDDNLEAQRAIHPEKTMMLKSGVRQWQYVFNKVFHVSPFNPLDMRYRWVMQAPSVKEDADLSIHMDNYYSGAKHFDATLRLKRRPFTRANMSRVLWRYPWMTLKVLWGIYWNALRLWLKKTPFYSHPHNQPETDRLKSEEKNNVCNK